MKNINGVDYNQLCVMEGTLMPEDGAEGLVKFFKDEMKVDVESAIARDKLKSCNMHVTCSAFADNDDTNVTYRSHIRGFSVA